MSAPDVVYPLVRKSQYEELRYSLRSLENVPHGRVFIAGAKPDWLSDEVIHIPVPKIAGETRYQNAEKNWRNALSHPDLSEDFIAMNDDFFIMQPMPTIPYYHDGSIDEYIELREKLGDTHENYLNGMRITSELCKQFHVKTPLGYTLHVPMLMNKYKRLALTTMMRDRTDNGEIVLMRTLYGNLFNVGGERIPDVKYYDDSYDETLPFLSTTDPAFKYERLGDFIRAKFPVKSQYEI